MSEWQPIATAPRDLFEWLNMLIGGHRNEWLTYEHWVVLGRPKLAPESPR